VSDPAPAPGDIVWLDFSPTLGTEQSGRRPALVISDQAYNEVSGRALLAPITSRVRGWPFEVALPAGSIVDGVIVVDQVRIVDWRARHARIADAAPAATLDEARAKLAALAGLP
jgi:mRNA interferase MazF